MCPCALIIILISIIMLGIVATITAVLCCEIIKDIWELDKKDAERQEKLKNK